MDQEWTISSYSDSASCVEVRQTADGIETRNSNDRNGPVVTYTPAEWDAFIKGVRNGEFDLM